MNRKPPSHNYRRTDTNPLPTQPPAMATTTTMNNNATTRRTAGTATATTTTTTGPSSTSSSTTSTNSGNAGGGRTLSSLQVDVCEARNVSAAQGPLYVQLVCGSHRLRVDVPAKGQRPEAVVFTQRRLEELYKETLVFALVNKETRAVLGEGSLKLRKLMIGRKVDQWYALYPTGPEATTSAKVRAGLCFGGEVGGECGGIAWIR